MASTLQQLRRSASRDKTVESRMLNRIGMQVARTVVARACYRLRPFPPSSTVAALLNDLDRDGYVSVSDFLPGEDFAAVVAAAEAVHADPVAPRKRVEHGANLLDVVYVDNLDEYVRGILNRFFANPTVLGLAEAAERRPLADDGVRTIQYLEQQDGQSDVQAEVHSDTFFTTHKAWLYLTDVTEADGPLVYYPGSHRLSITSLCGIYSESCGPNLGSRRITERELERRGIKPRIFTVPSNTFVFANTFGYHARRLGQPPGRRITLHFEFRANPFRLRQPGVTITNRG